MDFSCNIDNRVKYQENPYDCRKSKDMEKTIKKFCTVSFMAALSTDFLWIYQQCFKFNEITLDTMR